MEQQTEVRPELEELPARLKKLPVDERGYPVPWFVEWIGGKPEFRAMSLEKMVRAVNEKLCWVCGEKLGVHLCFVAGPMCGINRTVAEPPSHLECARWSARNCPFLNNPRMVRRDNDTAGFIKNAPGMAIERNPGVTMLWVTRSFELFQVHNGVLICIGEPESVEWYSSGRKATHAEIIESIESGLPILEAAARLEEGGWEALERYKRRFEKWIPA